MKPVPAALGKPRREDYEYGRNGTANLFMVSQPLLGWRHVEVTGRRTARDFAEVLGWLLEDVHCDADKVVLVTDDPNTHTQGCLYEAFEPERSRAIAERLEWHDTPKHGSCLSVAEVELSVLQRQCLDRRIATMEEMAEQVWTWQEEWNGREMGVEWQSTAADARVRLRRLYTAIE